MLLQCVTIACFRVNEDALHVPSGGGNLTQWQKNVRNLIFYKCIQFEGQGRAIQSDVRQQRMKPGASLWVRG